LVVNLCNLLDTIDITLFSGAVDQSEFDDAR
jgi:hypothetical protein